MKKKRPKTNKIFQGDSGTETDQSVNFICQKLARTDPSKRACSTDFHNKLT